MPVNPGRSNLQGGLPCGYSVNELDETLKTAAGFITTCGAKPSARQGNEAFVIESISALSILESLLAELSNLLD